MAIYPFVEYLSRETESDRDLSGNLIVPKSKKNLIGNYQCLDWRRAKTDSEFEFSAKKYIA